MLLQKQLPAFNAVPPKLMAGLTYTVTCKLDPGIRAHVIWLAFGNNGVAAGAGENGPGQGLGTLAAQGMIAEMRLLWGGKVQRRFTACELNALNALNNYAGLTQFSAKTSGVAGAAGYTTYLPFYLSEPFRHGQIISKNGGIIPESELGAWNLDGTKDCVIEVDLIGRSSIGAVDKNNDSPFLSGFIEYDAIQGGIGSIVKFRRTSIGVAGTPVELRDLDRNGGAYQSVHLFPTSQNNYVASLLFTRNSEQIRQDITRFQNDAILIARGLNPVALDTTSTTTKQNTGLFNLVFDYNDVVQDFLPVLGANELTLKMTLDAAPPAASMNIISQIVGAPD